MAEEKKKGTDLVDEDVVAAGAVVNVMEYLDGIDFPATRDDVEKIARRNGADESAIEEIRYLPEGARFENPATLIAALGREVKEVLEE